MNKLKLILLTSTLTALFACAPKPTAPVKTGYLKDDISPAELQNAANYKRYYYTCTNFETGADSYLSTYFPLSRESRMKDNFGIYFQLDGDKARPFDHIENKALNAQASRFEVTYRSYRPIQGDYIDLVAHEHSSVYYKNHQGMRMPWLDCRES
ncbi:hypothetical protein P7M47_00710 [Bisgaard Taxon 10/6]|uniref:Lipoprotein n=1 Tax=Exercitatus varius TaxID=67857 RepID=A0AAW6QAS7_9PAST|nr:hypothetical protein [Exercitatus varius]MDG2914507.1 hypothetical protein [Exercitatus varius]MDG2949566.1 hypothetical protein [Exercitatus varius]MDG2951099.1 hypothetical protein [Exercitatus varius]MDG2955220.1 hypothetical protein [Exercitatus varius]MDG2962963.1 hypothetical protein [Exercitatus varius]